MIKNTIITLLCFQTCFAVSNYDSYRIRRAQRQVQTTTTKSAVTTYDGEQPAGPQSWNGDKERYADLRAVFGKALNHLDTGFIDPRANQSLERALKSGVPSAFNAIELGFGLVKLVNPQAALAYSLTGNDCWATAIPPAPTFASAETAGEMVELYWTVLARDIPFNKFLPGEPTIDAAVANLNTLTDFRGPKINGEVTPGTFLRGSTPGELIGPYISQFLFLDVPYGTTSIPPEQNVPLPGNDNNFMKDLDEWFTVINGGVTGKSLDIDPTKHFLRTPRDLGEYVHLDSPGQAAFNAALILLSYGNDALDPNSYYLNNPTQYGFVTFGVGQVLHFLREAIEEGLKAAWYHKWIVNLRQRPEEFGFYLQQQKVNGVDMGISSQLLASPALTEIFMNNGTYLLHQAYPEGCPTHPSYPAGHAALMGAAVTVLKAFFNEDFILPVQLQPNDDNSALETYMPMNLTVGGELNKLASNISLGRDHAGVHYRSDGLQGMLLGEQVAISILNNESFLINENFQGFNLTKFDGTKIRVGGKRNP